MNERGTSCVSSLTNKHNGLPQYGCYRETQVQRQQSQPHYKESEPPAACNCCGLCIINCEVNCCRGCGRGCKDCGLPCRYPTLCCLGSCAPCCLCVESCCCLPCALQANRLLIRQHYQLPPDPCIDACPLGCYNCCLGTLYGCYCCCPSRHSKPSNVHRVNPYTYPSQGGCCLQCARGWSGCCSALCMCWTAGCALAQNTDHLERQGYPLPSVFSPPDIAGMR
ncbi:hypothetical protein AGDE_16608 [Angomonas deanei]|uniref:PLAC8 family n=1 Tax=Angomonas deanei TaxID=59799 RepID=S9THA5_9TRYP|nr:hypothetical protein AGDE_16999 [Angomonas deanei]EPY16785.1 hypothetical protein AGDE_16608 [Angomonas deanei]CAD2219876.1 hypothetical protein, conserved [Angomonas deanei]|eukprot:EPY15718.1 hypothetical protein AGDE_16999 [Angomonas deanei]